MVKDDVVLIEFLSFQTFFLTFEMISFFITIVYPILAQNNP